MIWYIVFRKDTGEPYSIGSQLADPLPEEFDAVALSEAEAAALMSGQSKWDAALRQVVPV
jgi:hypothetical protein